MRTKLDQYIIDQIRERRMAHDISQDEFSEKMGFKSSSFVASTESAASTKKYNVLHINKAAIILKCSFWDLVPQIPFIENPGIRIIKTKKRHFNPKQKEK